MKKIGINFTAREEFEYKTPLEEFKILIHKYIGASHTEKTMHDLHDEFRIFFYRNGLHDLQYKIKDGFNGVVLIEGIREIDRYALKGLLAENSMDVDMSEFAPEEFT